MYIKTLPADAKSGSAQEGRVKGHFVFGKPGPVTGMPGGCRM
jgi:hypothetical protein